MSRFLKLFSLFALLTAASLPRILISVDFTDEAFVLAVCKHLMTGARLFIDEIDIHQTTAPYAYAFFKAFSLAVPDLTGVFIFIRTCMAFILSAIGLAFIFKRSPDLPIYAKILCILPLLVFRPGLNGFIHCAGAYMAWSALVFSDLLNFKKQDFKSMVWAGVLAGAIVGFYQTVLFMFIVLLIVLKIRSVVSWKVSGALSLGFFLGVLPVLVFSYDVPLFYFWETIQINTELFYPFYSIDKINNFLYAMGSYFWLLVLLPFGWLLNLEKIRQKRELIFLTLIVLMTAVTIIGDNSFKLYTEGMAFAFWLCAIGFALGDPHLRSRLSNLKWFIILALCIVVAYTSDSSPIASLVWVLTPVCSIIFAETLTQLKAHADRSRYTTMWVAIAALSASLTYTHLAYFHDSFIHQNLEMVSKGPFKYIWTHKDKVNFILEAGDAIEKVPTGSRMIVYYNFPAGYLMSGAHPFSNYLWAFINFNEVSDMNRRMFSYYTRQDLYPEYIVQMKRFMGKRNLFVPLEPVTGNELHDQLMLKGYSVINETVSVKIYKADF